MNKIANFKKLKMADGFSFENVYIAISQPQPNFKEIWSADANFDSDIGWVTKFFHKSMMADAPS